jgi:osmotically-inducible protein OsmY
MNLVKTGVTSLVFLTAATFGGCSRTAKSPDVEAQIHTALNNNANLKDVSVGQDRDKGVVTLGGHVASEADRGQAESIARSIAGNQVIADQIAVLPPGGESTAKTVNSDLDKGIDKNVDAALIQSGIRKGVKHSVKNGVVTLDGQVASENRRMQAQNVASAVPNVRQVVNELQVKDQKASSSN